MTVNTEVKKGYRVEPAESGGYIVYPSGGDGTFRRPLGAFTDAEDLITFLAAGHQAEVVVLDQEKFANVISQSFVQGQAAASTKQ